MAVQKRSLMVKGSVWTANKDVQVEYLNHSNWSRQTVAGPTDPQIVATKREYLDLKKGDKVTILDKSRTYHPATFNSGIFIPVTHEGAPYKNTIVEFSEIKDHLDLLEGVKQSWFYVYNSTEDKYLLLYERPDYDWRNPPDDLRVELTWTDKLSKAKKHKMLHQSRQYMLGFTGYFADIEFEGDYIAESIVTGPRAKDVPKDLVIQEYDKITKVLLNEYPLQPWLDYMFRLRPLTVKYGSHVRTAFKEIADKKLEMSVMIMIKDPDDDGTGQYEVTKPIRAVKEQFKATKPKKGSYVMKSSNTGVAIAFADPDDVLVFRLQLSTDLDFTVVDANDLSEIQV